MLPCTARGFLFCFFIGLYSQSFVWGCASCRDAASVKSRWFSLLGFPNPQKKNFQRPVQPDSASELCRVVRKTGGSSVSQCMVANMDSNQEQDSLMLQCRNT